MNDGRRNRMWLSRLGHKRHCSPFLACSLGSLTLGNISFHTVRTPKQPYGDLLLTAGRNSSLQPTAMREIFWKQILQPTSSLQMTVALANILKTEAGIISLAAPGFLLSETIWDVCYFKLLNSVITCYSTLIKQLKQFPR